MLKALQIRDGWSQLFLAGSFHLSQLAGDLRVDSNLEVSICRLTGTVPFCNQFVGDIQGIAEHSFSCEGFLEWWNETPLGRRAQ